MKYKCKFLLILTFVIVLLFYNAESPVAMAAGQNPESITEAETGQSTEPAAKAETEQSIEPAAKAEAGQPIEPAAKVETEQSIEPAVKVETGQPIEPAAKVETGQPTEPAAGLESEQNVDLVSTGQALTEWLEAHKNTGGTVKLADHVVLDKYYSYCPNGVNMLAVLVDTDKYTITVTGEIELLSDGNLTFSGQPDGKAVFYVAPKGVLSLQGIAVEGGQCALWQEEGAGLVVGDCDISGDIHYADSPFVMDQNPVCVIVEKEQTLDDVLPAQISCTVNRQGKLYHNEQVPLVWSLEGHEKQQEERRRFRMQGSFLYAAAEPALCTVAYSDYPLTFTDVNASVCGSIYMFRGWYTKQGGYSPGNVISEYSFDGENWLMCEETNVTGTYDGFVIALDSEQCGMAAHSNIYIRLQWKDNENRYFSNVLCYATDDLERVEDIGGSRGGGTAIINPPESPQKVDDDASVENEGQDQNVIYNTKPDSTAPEMPSDTNQTEKGDEYIAANSDAGQPLYSDIANADTRQVLYSASPDTEENQPVSEEEQPVSEKSKTDNTASSTDSSDSNESIKCSDFAAAGKEEGTVAFPSVYGENHTDPPAINEYTLDSGIRESNATVIAAGFVLLSAIVGIAGFCFHFRSGTKR